MKGYSSTVEPQFLADGSLDLELMQKVFRLGLEGWAKKQILQAPQSPVKASLAKTAPKVKVRAA